MLQVALLLFIGLYLITTAVLYVTQEKFIFRGVPIPHDFQYNFSAKHEERFITMPDGAVINTLYFTSDERRGVIFYNHGNGGELPRWGEISYFFLDMGYDVFVYDYRGYGKSTGHRSESLLLEDAQLLYDHVKQDWEESQIIVYGRSLGSGPASYVAGKNNPQKLILETPFYSLRDVAGRYFPFFPFVHLIRYPFRNAHHLTHATTDIHIFHGTSDMVVPIASGKRLHRALNPEKAHFHVVHGATHHNLLEFAEYRAGVQEILRAEVS